MVASVTLDSWAMSVNLAGSRVILKILETERMIVEFEELAKVSLILS